MRLPHKIQTFLIFSTIFLTQFMADHSSFAQDSGMNLDPQMAFGRANLLYDKQEYSEAIKIYSELHESLEIKSPSILFNLGNAFIREGKKGHAIASYLAARRYAPTDPDIKANLKFVLDQTQDKLETKRAQSMVGTILFWLDVLDFKSFLYVGFLFLGLAILMLGIKFFRRNQENSTTPILILFLLACFIGFVSSYLKHANNVIWGAVTVNMASIHSSPNESGVKIFELREGAPFIKIDSTDHWVQIELSDGKRGWIKKKDSLIL